MSRRNARKPWAIATVLAVAVTAAVGGVAIALASHSGSGELLTTSNGSRTITFSSGRNITTPNDPVIDAAWSPDGSRAIFVNPQSEILTVRYDDGRFVFPFAEFDPENPDIQRKQPTWRGSASAVVWSERGSSSAPWRLKLSIAAFRLEVDFITPDDGFHYTHPDGGNDPDGGPGSNVVYQRQADSGGDPTGVPEVWLYDPSAGGTPQTRNRLIIGNAANPALSPSGTRVAFVRPDGSNTNQIFTSNLNGEDVVQVTKTAGAKDNPVWSPDGTKIAFNNGGAAVATAPADGSADPTGTGMNGSPAYLAQKQNVVNRLAASGRFGTAVKVSQFHWATVGEEPGPRFEAKSVVLSRSDTFADALGGGPLAVAKEGPLLLTPPNALNEETQVEIKRVLPTGATVYVLGGETAISPAVVEAVQAMGYVVKRLAGTNRFATSVSIAREITPKPEFTLAATGLDFPDALAAGAAAGSFNVPGLDLPGAGEKSAVVLTAGNRLPAETRDYLDEVVSEENELYAIGRHAADATRSRFTPDVEMFEVAGENRFETAIFTGFVFFGGARFAGVATSSNWPDALAGGALLGTINGALLLTPSGTSRLNADTAFYLDDNSGSIDAAIVFGGSGVVSEDALDEAGKWISGPAGFVRDKIPAGFVGPADNRAGKAAIAKTNPESRPTPAQLKAAAKALSSIPER